jgi:hypothetical protein
MDSAGWRVTQKWISVEVPWHAKFEEKFQIILTKESPVVLVLSQLDDRYFNGLQGQYRFRLQFRLHEADSPGEEDYIVRSHGNYLMERSVVTELKSLRAGTYSVSVMVAADRDINMPSVEDIVKEQCQQKVDNDKLAQVGMAYDFAHSKGTAHMESRATARRAQEKREAREARIAIRRKNWEKRHLTRDIIRKQEKKNREKRELKQSKDAARAREKEEKGPKDAAVQTEDVKEVTEKEGQEGQDAQTEAPPKPATELETQSLNGNGQGVQTDNMSTSFIESQGTPETPKSGLNTPPSHITIPIHYQGGPPAPEPPYRSRQSKDSSTQRYPRSLPQHSRYITSDGESSASPISDSDDMYSDNDSTLKPRPVNSQTSTANKKVKESDEDEPEPWNAVCIVGLRVYSKDEGLEVKDFEEGIDDLVKIDEKKEEEDGMDGTDADVEDHGDGKDGEDDEVVNEKKMDVAGK